jgi:hypothetical protein
MSEYTNLNPSGNTGFDIARLNIAEATPVNLFGYNAVVGSDYETLWNVGGEYPINATEGTLSVVSSASGDSSKRVLIQGVDGEFEAVSQVVTLDATDATTPVVTTQEFLRVNQVILLDGENAGNITITRGASTLGYIAIGEGISQACQYTVPKGYSLYLFRITMNSATANPNKFIRFRNLTQDKDGRVLRVARATSSVSQVQYDRQIPFRINECTFFEFEAQSSSGENEVAMFVECVLLKNPWGRD